MGLVLGRVAAVLHVTLISEQERRKRSRSTTEYLWVETKTAGKSDDPRKTAEDQNASSSHKCEASTPVGIEQESMEVFRQIITSRQERQCQAVAQVAGWGYEKQQSTHWER